VSRQAGGVETADHADVHQLKLDNDLLAVTLTVTASALRNVVLSVADNLPASLCYPVRY